MNKFVTVSRMLRNIVKDGMVSKREIRDGVYLGLDFYLSRTTVRSLSEPVFTRIA